MIPNYLYIFKPQNRKDMQKLYECFAAVPCKRTICQKDEDYFVKVETKEEIKNIREVLAKVRLSSANKYQYLKG